jgi:transcriptional regulator with XRE-family HTH domain
LTGKELRRIRLQLELTQEALAMQLGVKRNTVTRWETGIIAVSRVVELAMRGLAVEHGLRIRKG